MIENHKFVIFFNSGQYVELMLSNIPRTPFGLNVDNFFPRGENNIIQNQRQRSCKDRIESYVLGKSAVLSSGNINELAVSLINDVTILYFRSEKKKC